MIDEYNSGSINVEELFRRLMEFAQSLTKRRTAGCGPKSSAKRSWPYLIFLPKPEIDLTRKEREQV